MSDAKSIWPQYGNDGNPDGEWSCPIAACAHALQVLYPGFTPSDESVQAAYKWTGTDTRKALWWTLLIGLTDGSGARKRFGTFGTVGKDKQSLSVAVPAVMEMPGHVVCLIRAGSVTLDYVSAGMLERHGWNDDKIERVWSVSEKFFDLALIASALRRNWLWWLWALPIAYTAFRLVHG